MIEFYRCECRSYRSANIREIVRGLGTDLATGLVTLQPRLSKLWFLEDWDRVGKGRLTPDLLSTLSVRRLKDRLDYQCLKFSEARIGMNNNASALTTVGDRQRI